MSVLLDLYPENSVFEPNTSSSKYNLICDACGMGCTNAVSLRQHQQKFHSTHPDNRQKTVACELCGSMYTSRCNMLQHVRRMHEGLKKKEYICAACEAVFRTRKSIRSHLRTHEQPKSHDLVTLLKCLPEGYSYQISNYKNRGNGHFSATLEFQLDSLAQGMDWVTQYQDRNYLTFRKCPMRPSVKPDLFKVKFRCHHKTMSRNATISRKNTNCPAVMLLYMRSPKKSSKFIVATGMVGTKVKLIHIHNHCVGVESLRYRTPSKQVENEFMLLFEAGYKPANALRTYLHKLKLEYEDKFSVISNDRSICPDRYWVYYLYRKFNKKL